MSIIKVGSLCRYLTETDGLQWRSEDYHSRILVKAAKGESFKGYIPLIHKGITKHYYEADAEELLNVILPYLSNNVSRLAAQQFELVPIPNSGMAVGADGPFKIAEIAKIVSDNCVTCSQVRLAIEWLVPKQKSHLEGGFRSPARYEGKLQLRSAPKKPVVLFDDVITSGSQMIACARFLRDEGFNVIAGITVGRSVKVQEKALDWHITELELDPPTVDLSAFFK